MRPPRMDTAQLSLVRQPSDDPNFLFELKQDGFRALAHKSFQDLREVTELTPAK